MASILKRTAFYEVISVEGVSYHLPYDWALVQTPVGPCAEPFNINTKALVNSSTDFAAFTKDNELTMVNEYLQIDTTKPFFLGDRVNGGTMLPRAGR